MMYSVIWTRDILFIWLHFFYNETCVFQIVCACKIAFYARDMKRVKFYIGSMEGCQLKYKKQKEKVSRC